MALSHAKYLVMTNADILPIIISNLDQSSLLSSALVSRLFNEISTQFLYSRVELKNVKGVDTFLGTLNRTKHRILYNTIHTKEFLVNNIQSITMDSPNLAYMSGEKLSKIIKECEKVREVVIGKCTLSKSIINSIAQLEKLSILKFNKCSVNDTNILNPLISESSDISDGKSSESNHIITNINTNTNKRYFGKNLRNIITTKLLNKRRQPFITIKPNKVDNEISSIPDPIYKSNLTNLTHLTIDIQPSCSSRFLISLACQNKSLRSLDLQFQGLDDSLLTITQNSLNLQYLKITECKNLSEQTILQLIQDNFSTPNTKDRCRLKELLIDYGPFSEKFLLSLSNLCKTQRKISVIKPPANYHGYDLKLYDDSLEISIDHSEDIGNVLLKFYLNIGTSAVEEHVGKSNTINNAMEELLLDGIQVSPNSLNIICQHLVLKSLKLQNIPITFSRLTKHDIINSIKLSTNLYELFVTETLQSDDTNKNYSLKSLNYSDFNELAKNCPNLKRIYWNHKLFVDKFTIHSKFVQFIDI
ncbi:4118_t:CDS:1 [Funneliformis caledonium]|uniref:4118_t:CDS:1 n=1 Tax=Funneliformis caledonium TaxID=1117310 RepID=A0A9N8YRV9_9GLOM|nr:4118_t:CDS:1 [Funneliformis caledonium]